MRSKQSPSLSQAGKGMSPDATVLWHSQEAQVTGGRNSDRGRCLDPWQPYLKTYEISAEWSCESECGFLSQCVVTTPASLWSDPNWSLAGSRLPSHLCVPIKMPWTTEQRSVSAFKVDLSDPGVNIFPLFSFSYLEISSQQEYEIPWVGSHLSLPTPCPRGS